MGCQSCAFCGNFSICVEVAAEFGEGIETIACVYMGKNSGSRQCKYGARILLGVIILLWLFMLIRSHCTTTTVNSYVVCLYVTLLFYLVSYPADFVNSFLLLSPYIS